MEWNFLHYSQLSQPPHGAGGGSGIKCNGNLEKDQSLGPLNFRRKPPRLQDNHST